MAEATPATAEEPVVCSFTILGGESPTSRKKLKRWQQDEGQAPSFLLNVCLKGQGPGDGVHANRLDLGTHSDYFETAFTTAACFEEQGRAELQLQDISTETLRTIVCALYARKLTVDDSNIKDLLLASDRLHIECIKTVCTDYLVAQITPSTAVDLLELAVTFSAEPLRKACCKAISIDTTDNLVDLWQLATKYSDKDLWAKVLAFVRAEFSACLADDRVEALLTKLPMEQLLSITGHQDLTCQETLLFEAITDHLMQGRSPEEVLDLLQTVRYEHIATADLQPCLTHAAVHAHPPVMQRIAFACLRRSPDLPVGSEPKPVPEERQTKNANLTWRIHGWSDQKERLLSPSFKIAGSQCTWRLVVFPKGNGKKAKGWVSAYIYPCRCIGEPRKETISYRIEVLHPSTASQDTTMEGMYKFSYFGSAAPTGGKVAGGGFPRLIPIMDVRSGKYVRKGNVLVMRIRASFLDAEPLLI